MNYERCNSWGETGRREKGDGSWHKKTNSAVFGEVVFIYSQL